MPDDMGKVLNMSRRGMAWMGELTRGDKGPHATASNAILILCNDAAVAGLLAYDEFAHRVMVTRPPPPPYDGAVPAKGPYPRPMTDNDVTLMQGYMARTYELRISHAVANQAATAASEQNLVHPIRDWLNRLTWDGKERLATWLHVAFGCPKDAYHEAVGTKYLVAAVRRIRHPGSKFDAMLVLEGDQDLGKSSACRALFGDDNFSDDMPHDLASKDAPHSLMGVWGMELGELDSLIRTGIETVKAFLSRQVDHYRPPYERNFVDRPRQCVLVGTTNENDWMRDSTGNRRFWPVRCLKAEHAWLAEMREQLWAEAAALELEGEPVWLDDEAIRSTAKQHQAERVAEDMWKRKIVHYLFNGSGGSLAKVRTSDLLEHAVGLSADKMNRANEMRAAAVLRALGWRSKVEWVDGKSERWWRPQS